MRARVRHALRRGNTPVGRSGKGPLRYEACRNWGRSRRAALAGICPHFWTHHADGVRLVVRTKNSQESLAG
jgi:hypothetical protein